MNKDKFKPGDVVMLTANTDLPTFDGDHPYTVPRGDRTSKVRGPFVVASVRPGQTWMKYAIALKSHSEPGRNPGWGLLGQERPHMTDATIEALRAINVGGWSGWHVAEENLRLATKTEKRALTDPLRRLSEAILSNTHPTDSMSIEEYKEFVEKRVREEAERQGWCDSVDTWLDSIGIQPPKKQKVRLSIEYSAEVEVPEGWTVEKAEERIRGWKDERSQNYSVFGPSAHIALTAKPNTMKIEEI